MRPGGQLFSHVTIGVDDVARAADFYDRVMACVNTGRFHSSATAVGYGDPRGMQFWVVNPYDGKAASAGNGTHVAFLVASRAEVRAFHATALANGGTDEGAPGLRPHYHPDYYGAYVRDPYGNKLQACCHTPE
jgi:catechol 2,3-dioxygenase-like lactoylglutathione lyase family enzyme